jgi:hypothetical protein
MDFLPPLILTLSACFVRKGSIRSNVQTLLILLCRKAAQNPMKGVRPMRWPT